MAKTLKQLQEEFPYMCRTCGAPDQLYCYKFGHDSGLRIRLFKALIAKLDAQDKVIAANNLEGLRGLMEWALEKARAADAAEVQVKELGAKLTAEQQAHAATKEELWEAQETVQQQAWELREVDQAALARQAQHAADAAKEK